LGFLRASPSRNTAFSGETPEAQTQAVILVPDASQQLMELDTKKTFRIYAFVFLFLAYNV